MKAGRFTTRKAIREKLKAILLNATDAGCNVFATFPRHTQEYQWPAIFIYPNEEDYTKINVTPKTTRRDLSLRIEIIAADSDECDTVDILDTIADQIETVVNASDDLGKLVHDINIDKARGAYSLDGPTPEGAWVMDFYIVYLKQPGA